MSENAGFSVFSQNLQIKRAAMAGRPEVCDGERE
jgi:hypothetical protein